MNAENELRDRLLTAAREAARHAVAPYSGIHVAAALQTAGGEVVTGVNVESASYGLTCCAERVALFNALSQGHREFTAMGLISSVDPCLVPCGACRQLLAEYAPTAKVWCSNLQRPEIVRSTSVAELLPEPLVSLPENG